ncbi:MAG: hypothetical protein IKD70_09225 [Eggerthellaceae bacterium]|nr:hypothetical protein [Eggerthellaceae bacterium]
MNVLLPTVVAFESGGAAAAVILFAALAAVLFPFFFNRKLLFRHAQVGHKDTGCPRLALLLVLFLAAGAGTP